MLFSLCRLYVVCASSCCLYPDPFAHIFLFRKYVVLCFNCHSYPHSLLFVSSRRFVALILLGIACIGPDPLHPSCLRLYVVLHLHLLLVSWILTPHVLLPLIQKVCFSCFQQLLICWTLCNPCVSYQVCYPVSVAYVLTKSLCLLLHLLWSHLFVIWLKWSGWYAAFGIPSCLNI